MINKSIQTLRIPFALTPMSILEFDLNVALTFFSIEFQKKIVGLNCLLRKC
jgi:hypothetical protein